MNRFLLVTPLFVIAACAATGPEPIRSESAQAAEPTNEALLVHKQPAARIEGTEAREAPIASATADSPAQEYEGIEDLEAPGVSETPPEMLPPVPTVESLIVCERVIPTGSILPVKVCRNREDIERKRQADQEIFKDIKDNTAIGASRL